MSPAEPTAPQQIKVLEALRRGPSCLHEFGSVAYVARNRVGDLRRLGWNITAVRCHRHPHRGRVAEYRLLEGPPEQLAPSNTDGVGVPYRAPAPTLFPEPDERSGAAR